jgi:hypothetical protein
MTTLRGSLWAGVALCLTSCASGPGDDLGVASKSLRSVFDAYENRCACGTSYPGTNCAHYLSNAFLKAGYTLPDGEKCPKGRLIRAKEMLAWFRSLGGEFSSSHPRQEGYVAVYQESSGQGHVCVHREFKKGNAWSFDWRGTGDYSDWEVNWHFRF